MNRLLAIILMLSYGLHSQDHPVEINRLCGLLERVNEVPLKNHPNSLKWIRTPLPNVALSLYEQREGDPIEQHKQERVENSNLRRSSLANTGSRRIGTAIITNFGSSIGSQSLESTVPVKESR